MKNAATAGAEETVAAIGQLLVCPIGSIEQDANEESAKAMFNLPMATSFLGRLRARF